MIYDREFVREKYKNFFESSLDLIYINDLKGNFLDANDITLNALGYKKEEILKLSFENFVDKNQLKKNFKVLKQIKKIGRQSEFIEYKIKIKNGNFIYIKTYGIPLKNKGEIYAILSIGKDITKSKERKKNLLASKLKYQYLVDNSPFLIFLLDLKGNVIYYNNPTDHFFYLLTKSNLIGKSYREIWSLNEKDRSIIPIFEKCFCKIIKDEITESFEFSLSRSNGNVIWINIVGSFIKIENETLIRFIIQDVTEKKRTEQELKEAVEKYRRLFESSPYSILLLDMRGIIIDSNSITEKILDRKKNEYIDKGFLALGLYQKEDFKKLNRKYDNLLKGINTPPIELQIKKKDGTIIWIHFEPSVIKIGNKKLIQVIIHDITEGKKSEELKRKFSQQLEKEVDIRTIELKKALEQQKLYLDQILSASHFKSEFLATMSHELRTPLNVIIGFVDLLLEQCYGPLNKNQLTFIKDIKESSNHLLDMITHILDISKIEAGQIELNIQCFKLKNLINQIISTLIPLIDEKNLKIGIKGFDSNMIISADPIKLKQIFYNLLNNAIKFTIQGKITLKVKNKKDYWEFKVIDTGIGIAEKDYDIVFKEFKRIESPYVQTISGTGLGLPLTKRLVELHQGCISFSSKIGKGTTFRFTIPKNLGPDSKVAKIEQFLEF